MQVKMIVSLDGVFDNIYWTDATHPCCVLNFEILYGIFEGLPEIFFFEFGEGI